MSARFSPGFDPPDFTIKWPLPLTGKVASGISSELTTQVSIHTLSLVLPFGSQACFGGASFAALPRA